MHPYECLWHQHLITAAVTGKELFTNNATIFDTEYDADPAKEKAPPEVAKHGSNGASGAGGAGAGASGDAAAGVVDESNAALFMDEVELDGLEDD